MNLSTWRGRERPGTAGRMGRETMNGVDWTEDCLCCLSMLVSPSENPAAFARDLLGDENEPGAAICRRCGCWAVVTPAGSIMVGDDRTVPVPPDSYRLAIGTAPLRDAQRTAAL